VTNTARIDVRQLRKMYPGGVEAVKAIDFDVGVGEVFGLLGPNGAGKSTTIGMLTTTIAPTSGTAMLDGFDVARDPLAARRIASVVFQEPGVDRPQRPRQPRAARAAVGNPAGARGDPVRRDRAGIRARRAARPPRRELQRRPATPARDRPRARLAAAGNPRQVLVPLIGPILLALIVAPALTVATGGLHSAIDYQSFVGVGAIGLVILLSCIFAGLSVSSTDRPGAQRELLAAPVPRSYLVLGNLVVAVVLSALQAIVLVGLTALRGGQFHISGTGVAWALAAGLPFTVFMYGVAETLASVIGKAEEYVGAVPAVAILPFFFAGALFPIGAMPGALTAIAKVLPLTHALALLRYGLVDPSGNGLHDIWGPGNTTVEAWASLAVSPSSRSRSRRSRSECSRARP
jgi:ABC-type polysaccharide/polyol phosphate export permease